MLQQGYREDPASESNLGLQTLSDFKRFFKYLLRDVITGELIGVNFVTIQYLI